MFCSHVKHVLSHVFVHSNSPDEGPSAETQYRELTVGSLSRVCMWRSMFMPFYAVYWLRPYEKAWSLTRKCISLATIMVIRCVMRHAWRQNFKGSDSSEPIVITYTVVETSTGFFVSLGSRRTS